MRILSIIPLTKIPLPAPQVLDYFSSKDAAPGGVAQISLGSRKLLGIVIASTPVGEKKQAIKKSSFRLKSVEKIISHAALIPKAHLKLIIWASQYYYSPLGLVAKALLPRYFAKPTKQFLLELSQFNLGFAKIKTRLSIVPELYKIGLLQNRNPEFKHATIVHGGISSRQEWAIWKAARQGQLQDILGTRSVLAIAPASLARIAVYDAESPYHKSFDQQPYINAKNMALKLAEFTEAKTIYRTTFPMQEPCVNLDIVDMREEIKNGNYSIFSKALQMKLTAIITNNKQAILFINRKGLASGLVCRDCGNIIKCPNCDVPLVFHDSRILLCHHCAVKQNPPSVCPGCQSYKIKFIGTGTERVRNELLKFLPGALSKRLDLDTALKWERQKEIFADFCSKKFNVLIGTQLLLKEGLLPKVDLAAIITVDPLLSLPDFRMGEQVAKIIDMLARSAKNLIIQTYKPDIDIFKCLREYGIGQFYNLWMTQELEDRRALFFPPFSQIIKLVYAHKDPLRAEREAKVLKNKIQIQAANYQLPITNYQLLGPFPAFISRVKSRYIWQIMIKSSIEDLRLRNKLLSMVPSDWKVDVDPVEML